MREIQVFISYTMRGNEVSYEDLKALKLTFNQAHSIKSYIDILDNQGADHQAYVLKKLNESDVVLLIRSAQIENSCWVQKELQIADDRHIPIVEITVKDMADILSVCNIDSLRDRILLSVPKG